MRTVINHCSRSMGGTMRPVDFSKGVLALLALYLEGENPSKGVNRDIIDNLLEP